MNHIELVKQMLESSLSVFLMCEPPKLDEMSKLARELRPNAIFLGDIRNALDFFKFFEANADKDIVLELSGVASQDAQVQNLLKLILTSQLTRWSSREYSSQFTYTGNLAIIGPKVSESIKSRAYFMEV